MSNQGYNALFVFMLYLANGVSFAAQSGYGETLYEEKFESVEHTDLPNNFFVLEGKFVVTSKSGRKCLMMSGNPVGEHGFLFGPRINWENVELSFSCLGGYKSRRHNVFAGALGGIRGLNFRINPAPQEILLHGKDDWEKSFPTTWSSKEWMRVFILAEFDPVEEQTRLRIDVLKESAPLHPSSKSSIVLNSRLQTGKCALWGFSYAEQPMYWDDLLIRAVRKKSDPG